MLLGGNEVLESLLGDGDLSSVMKGEHDGAALRQESQAKTSDGMGRDGTREHGVERLRRGHRRDVVYLK